MPSLFKKEVFIVQIVQEIKEKVQKKKRRKDGNLRNDTAASIVAAIATKFPVTGYEFRRHVDNILWSQFGINDIYHICCYLIREKGMNKKKTLLYSRYLLSAITVGYGSLLPSIETTN